MSHGVELIVRYDERVIARGDEGLEQSTRSICMCMGRAKKVKNRKYRHRRIRLTYTYKIYA